MVLWMATILSPTGIKLNCTAKRTQRGWRVHDMLTVLPHKHIKTIVSPCVLPVARYIQRKRSEGKEGLGEGDLRNKSSAGTLEVGRTREVTAQWMCSPERQIEGRQLSGEL